MSTNYYAHIIPTKERKQELYDAIEDDDFRQVIKLTRQMYETIEKDLDTQELAGGVVHLGKLSGGWKFLWNPNVYVVRNGHLEKCEGGGKKWIPDPDTALYVYPPTKQGIKSFIDREDVLIYDEYDELQDKEEFWKMALTLEGSDHKEYEKKHPEHARYYSHENDLTRLLERDGYTFTTFTKSEFYSDGLRFASSTDFR